MRAERGQRGAVRLARRDALAQLVGRRGHRGHEVGSAPSLRRRSGFGMTGVDSLVFDVLRFEFGDGLIGFGALLQRLAVPVVLAFENRSKPFPFSVRATIIVGLPVVFRASPSAARICRMSWPSMLIGVPAEGLASARRTRPRRAPTASRGSARAPLTSVIAQRLSSCWYAADLRGFPDRAFGSLAVAQQHVGAVVGIDPARVQRDADAGREPLAERSGGDVDERQPRRRMPFEIGRSVRAA